MSQTIEEIQKLPYGELCAAIDQLAPQVIEARDAYKALQDKARLYTAARDLLSAGLSIGDKVQLFGKHGRRKNPLALVAMPRCGDMMFQVLDANGEPEKSVPVAGFMFEGYEKI